MNTPLASRLVWLALAALWGTAIYRLGAFWNNFPNYYYGWSVPVLCLILLRERWINRPPASPVRTPSIFWLWFLLFAVGWWLARFGLEVTPDWRLSAWLLALSAVGFSVAAAYWGGGGPWVRHFALPIFFLLLAVPWPNSIEPHVIERLSSWVATWTVWALTVLGVPAIRQGSLVEIATGVVGIEDACSGIRSFQATLMTSIFLGEIFRLAGRGRWLLVLAGTGLALGTNVLRTLILVWLCSRKGTGILNQWHDPAGFTVLAVNLILLGLLAWRLRRKLAAPATTPAPAPTKLNPPATPLPWAFGAGLIGCILLAELGVAAWFVAPGKVPAAGPKWQFASLANVQGVQAKALPDAARTVLGFDEGSEYHWTDAQGCIWQVNYLRWRPARNLYDLVRVYQSYHPTEYCLSMNGRPLLRPPAALPLTVNGVPFVAREMRADDRGRNLLVYNLHWVEGESSYADPTLASMGQSASSAWRSIRDRRRPTAAEHRVILVALWAPPDAALNNARILECLKGLVR